MDFLLKLNPPGPIQALPGVLYQPTSLGLFGLCHPVDGAENVKSNITSSEKFFPSQFV